MPLNIYLNMPLDINLNMPLDIDLNIPCNDSEVLNSIVPVIECNTTHPVASESNDSIALSNDTNFLVSGDSEEGRDTLYDEGSDEEYHEIVADEGTATLEPQHALNDGSVESHPEGIALSY
jgi:hypothetical protein